MDNIIDILLYLAYALVIIAALGAIILPLIKSLDDPKSLLKAGIGIVILLVIFGISYVVSSDEVTNVYTKFNVDAQASKIIGGVLITTYAFFVAAFASILFTEVAKNFK